MRGFKPYIWDTTKNVITINLSLELADIIILKPKWTVGCYRLRAVPIILKMSTIDPLV